ncbi:MAG: DUF4932 domain-containing protein [Acidobacteria bacterium]|nr:DUF4932 domain-containing protein [Acidobacteriota bacterium]
MKTIKLFILLLLSALAAGAQEEAKLPVVKAGSDIVSIQDGDNLKKNAWRLAPEAKPDVYEAELVNGRKQKVTFITDVDSISFDVEEGKKYDFIIQKGDTLCYTEIVGTRFTPAADFDEKYRKERKGRTFVDIPEVYELVNIAIAMTPTGIADKDLVYQNSDYYKAVRAWFDPYRDHPLLAALDAELKKEQYFNLKMNGYAFEFDKANRIVRSKTFDRTGWGRSNALRPFLEQLQSFSDQTRFREFFKRNKKTYAEQIRFYRETADIAEMKRWLDRNFPSSNDYDTYNIVFSPLVAYNQSTNWFESNGFKELQPHVNFPYPQDFGRYAKDAKVSEKSMIVFRGNIVFTEINHGYINPEAEKYADRIAKAISRRDFWVDKRMGPNYYGGNAAFNEYMNWALVSLRIVDYVPETEQPALIAAVDRMMTASRGFPQFEKLDKFLIPLYKNRKPGQTLADLYPQIIEWFEQQNQ